jgi:hypothetical protein
MQLTSAGSPGAPLLVISFLAVGCVPALTMRAPNVQVVPSRLAVVPANVDVAELTFDGLVPHPQWTAAAEGNVDAVLEGVAVANGASVVDPNVLTDAEVSYDDFLDWSERALIQISLCLQEKGCPEDRRSVAQWSFRGGLESWRPLLNADFVLVVLLRDSHESTGKAIANFFTMVQVHAQQTGIACVVRLSDGQIVWCEHRIDGYGDLREVSPAHTAVDRLVRGLFPIRKLHVRPPRPRVPPPPPREPLKEGTPIFDA